MGTVSDRTAMAFKTYQNKANVLVKDYIISEPFIPYSSVLGGLFACKVVYTESFCLRISTESVLFFFFSMNWMYLLFSLTGLWSYSVISNFYLKSYNGLTKLQRIEWNNRWVYVPAFPFPSSFFGNCCVYPYWLLFLLWQRYLYNSCHFYLSYVSVLCVLVRSLFRPTIRWSCYFQKLTSLYFCIRGKFFLLLKVKYLAVFCEKFLSCLSFFFFFWRNKYDVWWL